GEAGGLWAVGRGGGGGGGRGGGRRYWCTRERASNPGGVSSLREPSARQWTSVARPCSDGRGSIQSRSSAPRSTTTHENHGSPADAICSIEIGEGHEP